MTLSRRAPLTVRTPLGTTCTSFRCAQRPARSARWGLGESSAVAFRADQLRSALIPRRASGPPRSSWKSSNVRVVRPRRTPRSHAGSPTTLSATGRPARRAPATAIGPSPVAVHDVVVASQSGDQHQRPGGAYRPRPRAGKAHERCAQHRPGIVAQRQDRDVVTPIRECAPDVLGVRRRSTDVGWVDSGDNQDPHGKSVMVFGRYSWLPRLEPGLAITADSCRWSTPRTNAAP